MKKILFTALSLLSLMAISCVTAPVRQMNQTITQNTVQGFDISVQSHIEFGTGLYQSMRKGQTFTNGLVVNIKNNSGNIAKLIWNNSSITDSNGTHRLFLADQKYSTANNDMPSLILPPGSNNTKEIYSADSVGMENNYWAIFPMKGNDFTLVLCIEQEKEERFISINVKVRDTDR